MRKNFSNLNPWSYCERCGFLYPLSSLVAQQGLRVCTRTCFDNTDIQYRPFAIEEVLSDGAEEGVSMTYQVQQNPEEILF